MKREFQILYRTRGGDGFPTGAPTTLNFIASSEFAARVALPEGEFEILAVTELRAVVDWSKPVWDRTEFAAAIGKAAGTLTNMKGDGLIPWNAKINGVPRDVAMRWIEEHLNEPGKKIVEQLKAA